VGTLVSGGFLYLIAALNVVVLAGIIKVFRDMRRGVYDEARLEAELQSRGLMFRFLGPLARSIRASWQMYPIGVLFGLGFDTASEIAVLAISAGAAANGLPLYTIICLPILFAAGMSAMDTADGAFMSQAYGWAFSRPVRRVYYNLTVTTLSVAVAVIIGTVELLQIAADRLRLSGGFWGLVGRLDLSSLGYFIVATFVITWVVSYAVWRLGRIEERWAPAPVIVDEPLTPRL
jgi:nickel/cobalt transporter (NiCoT) family protein